MKNGEKASEFDDKSKKLRILMIWISLHEKVEYTWNKHM